MLNNFTFNLPTRIEFGRESINKTGMIARELGAKKVILVTDKGVTSSGLTAKVVNLIREAGLELVVFDDVMPNPRDTDCQIGGDMAISEGVDTVIALGGGSSMDTAKAIASLMTNPGPIKDVLKPNKLRFQAAPLICIPTTAGTGSEVTSFAVITLAEEKRKTCIFDEKVRPQIAICDPHVLLNVPSHVAAATGIDALTHAIEAYTCKYATEITDAFALASIRLISTHIRDMVLNRSSDSCEAMMMGSLLAGIAFGFSDVAGVHCLAEALGGTYDTPHGVANSIFLPIVFEYNAPSDVKKHVNVALAMGVNPVGKSRIEIINSCVNELKQLSLDLGIPKLKDLDYVDPNDFTMLAQVCMKNVSASSNPRMISEAIFEELYRKAYNL